MEDLTIEGLDYVSRQLAAGIDARSPATSVSRLLPFAEWVWLQGAGHRLTNLVVRERLEGLRRAMGSSDVLWTKNSLPAGLIRIRRRPADTNDAAWMQFLFAFERGALAAGLTGPLSSQLTGVVQEMEENVHHHSEAPRSGAVAFLSHPASFEFVVYDLGRGVLASLREAPEFADLGDHGTALELATSDGKSRYGSGSGRGWGFNDLVVGIANSNARIRFRSGDHLLEIDGSRAPPSTKIAQRASGRGFMVAVEVYREGLRADS